MSESKSSAGLPAEENRPAPAGASPPPPGPAEAGPVPPPAGHHPPPPQVQGPPREPSLNVGWIIAAMILFWPTAIPALFAALRGSRALGAGNWPLAADEAARAKRFSLISIWVAVGLVVLYVLFVLVAVLIVLAHGGWDHGYWGEYGPDGCLFHSRWSD